MINLPLVRPFIGRTIRPVLVDSRVDAPGGYGWPPVTGTTDGGGWWQWTVGGMMAFEPNHIRMLRAFAAQVRGGARVRVPVIDTPQQLADPGDAVPFGDGVPFSDGALFEGSAVSAYLESAVALRDDTAVIVMASGEALMGGDYFSLERAYGKGPELHMTQAVEHLGGSRWAVTVAPHFRQAHAAGTECEFGQPAFAATVPDTSTLWPEFDPEWIVTAEVTFVEAP